MGSTKIKTSQIDFDFNSISSGGRFEFVVTPDIFDTYKATYHDNNREVLDVVDMIEHEDLQDKFMINLNSYEAYIDGWEFSNSTYLFKNGTILFDHLEGGCSNAIDMDNSRLIFDDCNINAPQCVGNNGLIELTNNSSLEIVNCKIDARFYQEKSFIKADDRSVVYFRESTGEFYCANDAQNPNFGITGITVGSNGCTVQVENCPGLRIKNDFKNSEHGYTGNFIQTVPNVTAFIEVQGSVISNYTRPYGGGLIDINLDNERIYLNNSDFQGALNVRYESSNTVVGNGVHTYEEGDEVWDVGLIPGQMEGTKGFEFTDFLGFDFLEAVDVNPNDMSHIYEDFKFQWYTIDGQSGFILNPDPDETYTTSDLISMQSLNDDYGIHPYDDDPQYWNDGNWLGVHLDPYAEKFRFNEQVEITEPQSPQFREYVEQGKIDPFRVFCDFHNNSVSNFNEFANQFFPINATKLSASSLYLNGREINEIPEEFEDGVFHPRNNGELWDIFNNQWGGVIDFMNFDGNFDENGYEINDKNFTFRNLMVNSNWQPFPYFEKPLFKFNDCGITFMNCAFNIQHVDLSSINDVKSLFEFNNTNADYRNATFMNCGINVNNLQNGSGKTVNVIKLNDHQLDMENCSFDFQGNNNVDYGNFINSSISNSINDAGKTEINMKYSLINMWGFNNYSTCIKYENDCEFETRIHINYSTLNSQNMRVIVPNNSEINANFSDVNSITCIERDPNDFVDWQATTQYNQDDLVVWTDPGNQDNKRYVKVLQQFTTTGDTDGDFWNAMNNNDIAWYYTTEVRGVMYNAFDPNNFIQNFQSNGMFGMDGLNINNNFSCNQTNRFYIRMQDQNINDGHDTDVLSAISELARRLSAIEPN